MFTCSECQLPRHSGWKKNIVETANEVKFVCDDCLPNVQPQLATRVLEVEEKVLRLVHRRGYSFQPFDQFLTANGGRKQTVKALKQWEPQLWARAYREVTGEEYKE